MGTDIAVEDIIFFDGVCNLCNGSINFIIDQDPAGRFKFASLQSDLAREMLPPFGVNPESLESIVFYSKGRLYRKSRAVLEISRRMRGLWPALYVFALIPPFLRNVLYDVIARNRYRWFGKKDACRIPTPELGSRFLDS
jgi:predicted DCC family thiol-disulfide oxidoreductase YuxK